MESQPCEQPSELRMDELIKMKRRIEDRIWLRRGVIKAAEVIGFAGTFLCTNPTGYLICVIITALAIIADFSLSYFEYQHERDFQQLVA